MPNKLQFIGNAQGFMPNKLQFIGNAQGFMPNKLHFIGNVSLTIVIRGYAELADFKNGFFIESTFRCKTPHKYVIFGAYDV